ncbi:MAG TPA: hypothetical protein VF121_03870 [Thermoanaerobaculia bacterium]|nr:hypothetical protein [Thermoanaerobaculia bacterium]
MTVDLRFLLMLGGAVAALWAFTRWRLAVQAVLVLLIVEGAVRKWVVPGAQDLVYFAKDVLLLAAYAGFLAHRRRRAPVAHAPALWLALALGAAYGLAQAFNPRLPGVLVGILGFKAYFWYVPLLFVLPAVFPDDAAVYRFVRRYALLAIPVGLLAAAQFLSPSSSALNTYARASQDAGYVSTFGSSAHVRVTATFSYITGYSSYLLVTAVLLLTLLAVQRWRWRGQLALYLALAMTLLGMLMTGSRGPVFLIVLLFPIYWLLAVVRERGRAAAIGRQVLVLGLLAAVLGYAAPDAFEAFRGRAAGRGDVRSRIAAPFVAPFTSMDEAGFFGFGIGATHQAAAAVASQTLPYSWLRGDRPEVESGRVMLELGPLGFVLVYFVRLYLVVFALGQALRLRTRFHRALATAAFLIFLAQLPGAVVFDPTMGVYYWLLGGLLLTAMRLDREAVRAAAAAAAPRPHRPMLPVPVPALTRSRAAWHRP